MKFLLSIDGGGIRGLIPLMYLYYLEQDLVKIYGKTIYEKFDMFAGSSIGAIITGSIVYSEYKTIDELVKNVFTNENSASIFSYKYGYNFNFVSRLYNRLLSKIGLRPIYSSIPKDNLIKKYVKDATLKSDKQTLFTVYLIDTNEAKFYRNYKNDTTDLVSDVVSASSMAPFYFPSYHYCDNKVGIDGGVFATDPTICAYSDAINIYKDEEIRILSIGTGSGFSKKDKYQNKDTRKWGPLQWATNGIVDIIYRSEQNISDHMTRHFSTALGHKYVRINKPVDIDLDDITKIDELKQIAKDWYFQTRDEVLQLFKE